MVQCALAGHQSSATLLFSDDNMCSKVKVVAGGTTSRVHEGELCQDCPHALARSLHALKTSDLVHWLVQILL